MPSKTVYQYTGWKLINDQWHYLTGSGAITAEGLKNNVDVDMGQGHINCYSMPEPMGSENIKKAINLIYDLLDICPDNKQIGAALFACIGRSVLQECSPIDYCLWLHGLTGSKKSAITSVALSFLGDFSGGVFPANWSDTEADMEAKSFQCKDGVFCVDDFKPSINAAEAAKLHTKAERFVRNTGNQAGRGRRNNDMSSKATFHNRSMTIITGEDLPKGQSLLGRLLILELGKNSVDCIRLSKLQKAGRENVLSSLIAAYIQWLSSRIDGYKKTFKANLDTLRDEAIESGFAGSHARAASMYADMVMGADVFIEFLTDKGAISSSDVAIELKGSMHEQLKQAFKKQYSYLSEQDEVERFLSLLRSLFSGGNAHLGNAEHQNLPPANGGAWGWRCNGNEVKKENLIAQGARIGWYNESDNQVYLDPNNVFSSVQEMARKQGDVFLMSQSTLWRRMGERGLFLRSEKYDGSVRYTVKRVVNGEGKPRVLVLAAETIQNSN